MSKQPSLPGNLSRRCPRLGSDVAFEYCLEHVADKGPCFKICDCWWERFDVVDYLTRTLGSDMVKKLQASKPPPKVASLVDLIKQAQARCGIEPSENKKPDSEP